MKLAAQVLSMIVVFGVPVLSYGVAEPGKAAPDFEVQDANGNKRNLKEFAGKWLVLEWYNKDCPYVRKHYDSGNMQKIQKAAIEKGFAWLSVISSAKGKQGYLEAAEAVAVVANEKSAAQGMLLDSTGKMGRAYGAKTTPHMYMIDPKGVVVYAGAIDDNDSSNPSVIPKSKNFVMTAMDEALAGKKVATASSRPYGCSVKY